GRKLSSHDIFHLRTIGGVAGEREPRGPRHPQGPRLEGYPPLELAPTVGDRVAEGEYAKAWIGHAAGRCFRLPAKRARLSEAEIIPRPCHPRPPPSLTGSGTSSAPPRSSPGACPAT